MKSEESNSNVARQARPDPVRRGSHQGVALACVAALATMGGLTYAAVPLYRLFCQATGFGGTPMRAEKAPDRLLERVMRVRFDANVTPGMPWQFEPLQRTVDVKVGESVLAFYKATNTSDRVVKGSASFNVSPDSAGPYFAKVECFCFKEQTLGPGESIEMPVSFFVDPSISDNPDENGLKEITLSYTFYPIANDNKNAEATGAGREGGKGS